MKHRLNDLTNVLHRPVETATRSRHSVENKLVSEDVAYRPIWDIEHCWKRTFIPAKTTIRQYLISQNVDHYLQHQKEGGI